MQNFYNMLNNVSRNYSASVLKKAISKLMEPVKKHARRKTDDLD